MKLDQHVSNLLERLLAGKPRSADAIICLQGDRLDRLPLTIDLYHAGWAPKIVLTGNNEMMERRRLNDEDDLPLAELAAYCQEAGIPSKSLLIDEQAMNTKDQAVNTVSLAKRENWTRLLVVTSPYHLLRSFLTFVKQARKQKWSGTIVMQAPKLEWASRPSGRNKTASEMLTEELVKLERYRNDVASLEIGEQYENTFSRL